MEKYFLLSLTFANSLLHRVYFCCTEELITISDLPPDVVQILAIHPAALPTNRIARDLKGRKLSSHARR